MVASLPSWFTFLTSANPTYPSDTLPAYLPQSSGFPHLNPLFCASAMGGTEAFPDLGSHCSLDSCHQLDFLPFQCDSCKKMFCLEHRSYPAHDCPKADMKDNSVLICPRCASTVRNVYDERPDVTLEKHRQTSSCDPSNYERVMKKARCPVKRCRETLTFSNTHVCRTCNTKTCLKHRFPSDHACVATTTNRPNLAIRRDAANLAGDFMKILVNRNGIECGSSSDLATSKVSSTPSNSLRAH